MEITEHTYKRFVKDFVLPIPICNNDSFYYYIDLFDKVYNTVAKYNMFVDLWLRLGGNEEFFQYGAKVQNDALDKIKNSPAYNDFINDTRDLFSGYKWLASSLPKGQVYKVGNDGRQFLSIDLVKANYQALKYYTRHILNLPKSKNDLVLGTSTFDEFISEFTDEQYYKEAKKFRQVVFGNMNPKRQQKIQKYIINEILTFLFDNAYFTEKELKDYTSDEIVFDITDMDNTKLGNIIEKLKELQETMNVNLHIDIYKLHVLQAKEKVNPMFIREFSTGEIDFKCVENNLMPQVYKHYFGITDIKEEDLMFYAQNGLLAHYDKPLTWE